jgi:hypothetical protein
MDRPHLLKPQDIEIQVGRAVGGDFMKIVHKPTGICRDKGPPLLKLEKAQREMLREIEVELIQKGLTQHILPDRRTK